MTNARIAIVEDDEAVRETVADLLTSEGFVAQRCDSAAALFAAMSGAEPPDLIVLDLRLPDTDGLRVAGTIRATSQVPIIMLTGRSGEIDRILGLEIGADDYVVKPFNTRELLARIKAVLRRIGREAPPPAGPGPANGFRFDGHLLDLDARRLTGPDGAPIPLTVAEFDLLLAMVRARGRVLSRDQLLEQTHRASLDVFDRTIDVLVVRLRRKIEPTPRSPRYIRTERGVGYVFDADVECIGAG